MNITPVFKKEALSLVGGTALLYAAALLCGINKSLFASAPSVFGGIILLFACRSLIESLSDRAIASAKKKTA
jgi:hypothetical protein